MAIGTFYALSSDLVVVLHVGFIFFAVLGGLLVPRWPSLAWLHVPAMGWIAINQCLGWNCPLTFVEKWLRQQSGLEGYSDGFVSQYLAPLLGPAEGAAEPMGGLLIVGLNTLLYWWTFRKREMSRN